MVKKVSTKERKMREQTATGVAALNGVSVEKQELIMLHQSILAEARGIHFATHFFSICAAWLCSGGK